VTSSTPAPRRLPGGRARKAVAAMLPRRLKVALRRRFRGSYLFPAPPRTSQPGPRRQPASRVVTLPRPVLPGSPAGRPLVIQAPRQLFVPKRLAMTGLAQYEPHALETFLALLETAGPGAVVDIGANIGLYALLAAACSNREVHAFEPTPELVAVARAAAARNELPVVIEELALGREPGKATFFLSDTSDSSNSLAEGFRHSSSQLDVTVTTLDAYCARAGLVPAIVKVDTETTEPDVLAGAAETIARHRPWILCEVLPGRRPGDLAEVMAPHGYTWYHLRGDAGHAPVDRLDGDPDYMDLMYLLAPRPVDADFWARAAAWRTALDGSGEENPVPAEEPARVEAAAAVEAPALVEAPTVKPQPLRATTPPARAESPESLVGQRD
jgi:FkbM family methyltransferase